MAVTDEPRQPLGLDWRARAACRECDPDRWYPETSVRPTYARQVCLECPVRSECGWTAYRADERQGIWAGFRMDRASERAALQNWLGVPDDTAGNGTPVRRTCQGCGDIFEPAESQERVCALCSRYTDAAAPRARVQRLRALGWTMGRISAASGVPQGTLFDLLRPDHARPERMTRTNAEKIMGIIAPELDEAVTR
ncbi:WhiB family transcriptional regulator [Nocardia sp. CDC159]|uniref:Transcriptional regulator WhiB n=1 Tax=Nocardia pulmonis TaxID=2951408 RepID=A0A9X2IYF7_9NOCA|nr:MULTISPECIES: WhiB family transcriptional regulator [Nocardia]MCM6774940.1 WhiB family transcriptional regulator [Nocardia pulmonis]MCM6789871.1 WhiB family transcriptional regulator [Nocardia sp. CDC159]